MSATILLQNPVTNAPMLVEYEVVNARKVRIGQVVDESTGNFVTLPDAVAMICQQVIRSMVCTNDRKAWTAAQARARKVA
jgi:lysyl-tRNA synthetase class I